jgi:hypothetical protein
MTQFGPPSASAVLPERDAHASPDESRAARGSDIALRGHRSALLGYRWRRPSLAWSIGIVLLLSAPFLGGGFEDSTVWGHGGTSTGPYRSLVLNLPGAGRTPSELNPVNWAGTPTSPRSLTQSASIDGSWNAFGSVVSSNSHTKDRQTPFGSGVPAASIQVELYFRTASLNTTGAGFLEVGTYVSIGAIVSGAVGKLRFDWTYNQVYLSNSPSFSFRPESSNPIYNHLCLTVVDQTNSNWTGCAPVYVDPVLAITSVTSSTSPLTVGNPATLDVSTYFPFAPFRVTLEVGGTPIDSVVETSGGSAELNYTPSAAGTVLLTVVVVDHYSYSAFSNLTILVVTPFESLLDTNLVESGSGWYLAASILLVLGVLPRRRLGARSSEGDGPGARRT